MLSTRHLLILGIVTILTACGGGGGSSGTGGGSPPASSPPDPPPPTSETYTGINGSAQYSVKTTSSIVYGTAEINTMTPESFDLLLDLYEPDVNITGLSLPLVIIVHGGSFAGGSRLQAELVRFAELFASEGYIAVSIDYRLNGQDPVISPEMQTLEGEISPFLLMRAMLASAEDTVTAVRWAIDNAETYHIDANRIGLFGSSAGAITVLNVEYALDGYGFDLPTFEVVVDLWGALGLGYDAPSVLSPGTIVATDAPIIVVHGENDPTVDYDHALRINTQATAAGLPIELIANEGVGHGYSENNVFNRETFQGSGVTQARRVLDFVNVSMLNPDCLRLELTIDNCPLSE